MDKVIKTRVRLVIVKNNKLLLTYTSHGDFYFYIGGKLEYGETIEEACKREVKEECGEDIEFTFNKILYIRDFIKPEQNEHSVEFFILGDINKIDGIADKIDPEFPDTHRQVWVDVNNLPENLLPKDLTKTLLEDYKKGFPVQGEYIGAKD